MSEEAMNMNAILGAIFMLIGVTDFIIASTIIKGKLRALQAQISPGWTPEKREPLQQKARGLQQVIKILQIMGVVFFVTGLYFLLG